MYSLFMAVLIGLGVWTAAGGLRRRRPVQIAAGILMGVGTAFLPWIMSFWGEMLWFESLGYGKRFWDVFIVQVSAGALGMIFASG
ncbi:MAG: hypothetical protein WBY88_07560, partial [Desulfosarcina sp.]